MSNGVTYHGGAVAVRVHNADRSQMAAGYLRVLAGDSINVYSQAANQATPSRPDLMHAYAPIIGSYVRYADGYDVLPTQVALRAN